MYNEMFVIYDKILNRYIIILRFICIGCFRHNHFRDVKLDNLDDNIFSCDYCKKEYSYYKGKIKEKIKVK